MAAMGTGLRRRGARKALQFALHVRVFRRDGWLCHWCHRPVVFAPALRLLQRFARSRGHDAPLAYHDLRWTRRWAPLLDHLGAVIDHVEAFSRGGAHDESNFVTSCNKCNVRKNNAAVEDFVRASPARPVKGRFGEPEHWDGFSTLFTILAAGYLSELTTSERRWLRALTGPLDCDE